MNSLTELQAVYRAMPGRPVVLGEGKADHPRLLLLGEAPGGEEEKLGHPFVGKAGQHLNHFLAVLGIDRAELWITNVVKQRPVKISEKGRVSNRPPNRQEKALFTPLLMDELRLVAPEGIVTLGNTALQALLGKDALIGDDHGRWTKADGLPPIFALYHPAAVIYNRALLSTYEADLAALGRDLAAGTIGQTDI